MSVERNTSMKGLQKNSFTTQKKPREPGSR